jgi:hypothetical protein
LNSAKALLVNDVSLSESTRALINLLVSIIDILASKFGENSCIPASQDPKGKKKKRTSTGEKPGAQFGRASAHLAQVETSDEIVELKIDTKVLPNGVTFQELPSEKRQVFNILMTVHVTKHQVQISKDSNGRIYKADCPFQGAVQYGASVRGLSCYLSNFQLVPIERIAGFFEHQVGLPIGPGTVVNINTEAAGANLSLMLPILVLGYLKETSPNRAILSSIFGNHSACPVDNCLT